MDRLNDKVAIVTGAASGCGAATAAAMAGEGAKVVVADIDVAGAEREAAAIRAAGGEAVAVGVDLGDEDSLRDMISFAVSALGGLDILHNNAANTQFTVERDAALEHMETEVWDEVMRVNLRGTMLATKYAIPPMRARGGGAIVNMTSGAVLGGMLSATAYAVSKAGIAALTLYTATQHGKESIRCNAISPGLIVTPSTESTWASGSARDMMLRHALTPRLGRPEDVANAAIYLASDESTYMTGQIIQVNGGTFAHHPIYADVLVAGTPGQPAVDR